MATDNINRELAILEIKRFIGYLDEDMIERLQTAIRRIPASNVVEVVQCKDCIHSHKKKLFPTKLICDIDLLSVRDNFFCVNGDRRADNG